MRVATFLSAMLLTLCAACSRSTDFERMRLQQRANPYGASDAFGDGMAMRLPPSGAVTFDRGATAQEPPAETDALIARGAKAYRVHCAVCHGDDGSGQSVMTMNMPVVPPPSLLTPRVAAQRPGDLFVVVSAGRNRMPAYGWALSTTDRWAVVAYVRSLQPAPAQGGTR
jgi:mono/diheme cytochrome c family protein